MLGEGIVFQMVRSGNGPYIKWGLAPTFREE